MWAFMLRSKITGILFVLLITGVLVGLPLLTAQPSCSLESLLAGSSTDFQAVLSALPDTDLPKAIGIAETLRFKALHGDSSMTLKDVDRFKEEIFTRISQSKEIALESSDLCPHKIEAKEVILQGIRVSIPAHFVLSGELRILDTFPVGEAGSLLPEFSVTYHTESPPVQGKLTVDGQPYAEGVMAKNTLFFLPAMSPDLLLSIGTHTASVSLSDTTGKKVVSTWRFTVGMQSVPTEPIPESARLIGSFSVDASRVMKGADTSISVRVSVYETSDGRRHLEYELHPTNEPDRVLVRTRDPNWLRLVLDPNRKIEEFLTFSPKSGYAFLGNTLVFSYSYKGPGVVKEVSWEIHEGNSVWTEENPTVTRQLTKSGVSMKCTVKVVEELPDGSFSQMSFSNWKSVTTLWPTTAFSQHSCGLFNSTGKGSIPFGGSRVLMKNESITTIYLDHGKVFDLGSGSKLSVKTSLWTIGAGSGGEIANPATPTTKITFTAPGVCEIVHNIALEYQFQNEIYRATFKPETSFLVGAFKTTATVSFGQVPDGIIMGTSRKATVKKIELTVGEETKSFANATENWVVAQSSLFPNQPPIRLESILPGFKTWASANSFSSDYRPLVTFQMGHPMENGKADFQPLIKLVGNFFLEYPQIIRASTILTLPAFDVDNLLTVKMDPEDPEPIQEGQELIFKGVLTSLPGLSEGQIGEDGGQLNFLKGYEVTNVTMLMWGSWKEWEDFPEGRDEVEWSYQFQADEGSGTYSVFAGAGVEVTEKETGDTAFLNCNTLNNVTVIPGLNLKSPLGEFTYPMNISIPVETTYDDDLEVWKKITWKLNNKKWNPGEEPRPWIFLDRQGIWSVHAKLDLSTGTQELILTDTATFTVQPAEIRLSPKRKVVSSPGAPVSFNLNVLLNGQQVEDIGQAVEWEEYMLTAEVESIDWGSTFDKPNVAVLTPEDPPFSSKLVFNRDGAATILATVTIRLRPVDDWKPTNKEPSDPSTWVFTVPPVRADAWAIPKPSQVVSDETAFPKKGIAQAHRTYAPKLLQFKLADKDYNWTPLDGLQPKVQLTPAIPFPGGSSGPVGDLKLFWSGPEGQENEGSYFQPLLPAPGAYTIGMRTFLDFGTAGEIPLIDQTLTGVAESFYNLVKASIDPASFPIFVGQSQPLTFVIESAEPPPSDDPSVPAETGIQIQNGNFNAEIESVTWIPGVL